MNKKSIVVGVGGLILGILIAPIFMPVMPWGGQMMYRGSMMGGNQMMGQIDSHFIEQMIPHHDDAILMAEIALSKSEHQEIKTLAANVIKAQSEENEQMRSWYKTWFGSNVPDIGLSMGHGSGMMMHGGMMGDETDIATLESAKPFDKEFIEQMISHHQMAIMMATMLSRGTNRDEMKTLAKNIIDAQSREIDQMRSWYRIWYGQ